MGDLDDPPVPCNRVFAHWYLARALTIGGVQGCQAHATRRQGLCRDAFSQSLGPYHDSTARVMACRERRGNAVPAVDNRISSRKGGGHGEW